MFLKVTEGHRKCAIREAIHHFLLVVCSNIEQPLYRAPSPSITTLTVYVTELTVTLRCSTFLTQQLKL